MTLTVHKVLFFIAGACALIGALCFCGLDLGPALAWWAGAFSAFCLAFATQ